MCHCTDQLVSKRDQPKWDVGETQTGTQVWRPAQLQGDGHCTVSATKVGRQKDAALAQQAPRKLCKFAKTKLEEGQRVTQSEQQQVGGEFLRIRIGNKRKDPLWYHSSQRENSALKRSGQTCFPSRWRHLGPNHQVNKSSKHTSLPAKNQTLKSFHWPLEER